MTNNLSDSARSADSMPQPLLRLGQITKAYPGVLAIDDVNIDFYPGSTHVVLGQNGAGKSTLMNILYGLVKPDSGVMKLNGVITELGSTSDAIRAGIAYVQQQFSLVPILTVAENLALALHSAGKKTSSRQAVDEVSRLSEKYGLAVRPQRKAEDLSVIEQQRVELIKALAVEPSILLLDEPTSVLPPQEAQDLSNLIRRLAREGISIVLITHKLDIAIEVADRITVLRHGRVAGSVAPCDASSQTLGELMVGSLRTSGSTPSSTTAKPQSVGPVMLSVDSVTVEGDRGDLAVVDAGFEVRSGEIVGIAGVLGSGQVELAEALSGVRPIKSGHVALAGSDITRTSVRSRKNRGLVMIPADRKQNGLVSTLSVVDNLALNSADTGWSCLGTLRPSVLARDASQHIEEFNIRVPSLKATARTLSGGNAQKMVLARELSGQPRVVIMAFPTQGLDFSAADFVWSQIASLRNSGAAILLISGDLDELISLADRIVVMESGRITGELESESVTPEQIGLLMGGVQRWSLSN